MAQRDPQERPYATAEAVARYLRERTQALAIPPAFLHRLAGLLEERQSLLRHLTAAALQEGAHEGLRQCLQEITLEQDRLLQELERLLPPEMAQAE